MGKNEGIQIADSLGEPDPDQAAKETLSKIKHKFIVMSGKGGVGKTSVSVNLAISLSNMGYKVGLMDVDIHGPDIPRMLGLDGMMNVSGEEKLLPMAYSDKLCAVSIESLMPDKDHSIIYRGPMKHGIIRQFIGDVAWGNLDYLIVDSPPGTGDEPLTITQLIDDAQAIIVTTPQEVALADVRKSIHFCDIVNMNIFGIIENMSGYLCPHCGEMIDIFGSGGGEKMASSYGLNFLGKIPLDPKMVKCGDLGVSYQEHYADSQVSGAFKSMAEKMSEKDV